MSSLVALHQAWLPKPVRLFPPRLRPQPGQAASPEAVLSMLPLLGSTARLIHCLQTERGVTCGWLASVVPHQLFADSIAECRAATDAALEAELRTLLEKEDGIDELDKRAQLEGVDDGKIDAAFEAGDPAGALIALIIAFVLKVALNPPCLSLY